MHCDAIWRDGRLATMAAPGLAVVEDGLVAAKAGRIVYAGTAADAPSLAADHIVSCEGRLITPGLIDCHTHLVHAGERAVEFQRRLEGATYTDIMRAGGGIMSTVRATRAASEDELLAASLPRLDALIDEGATTIEVKSGYGLDLAAETRILRVARRLADRRRVRIETSFLAAHAVPPEFAGKADRYVAAICGEMLPAIAAAKLADAVDAFCENIAFSPAQVERVFAAAHRHRLPVKLHAEQLSNSGGAALAARHRALSADHLEHLDAPGVAAMAAGGVVATLLPGAYYFLRETQLPPVAALRAADVPIAIATDCNPGTSPLTSLLLAMNMAAVMFRLTVEECLAGVTRNAARALGLAHEIGTIEIGKSCDLAIWNVGQPAELVYRMGIVPLHARVWRGQ